MEGEVSRLETTAQELRGCQKQARDLEKRRKTLADEVAQLEKRQQPLTGSVARQEKREAELSKRVQELEQRAQAADERLATARRHLRELTALGLSLEDLSGFTQRLMGIAQKHGIKPETLRERLLRELEQLGKGLGLETLVELKQRELTREKEAFKRVHEEHAALEAATQRLRQDQAKLRATMVEERDYVRKETKSP